MYSILSYSRDIPHLLPTLTDHCHQLWQLCSTCRRQGQRNIRPDTAIITFSQVALNKLIARYQFPGQIAEVLDRRASSGRGTRNVMFDQATGKIAVLSSYHIHNSLFLLEDETFIRIKTSCRKQGLRPAQPLVQSKDSNFLHTTQGSSNPIQYRLIYSTHSLLSLWKT